MTIVFDIDSQSLETWHDAPTDIYSNFSHFDEALKSTHPLFNVASDTVFSQTLELPEIFIENTEIVEKIDRFDNAETFDNPNREVRDVLTGTTEAELLEVDSDDSLINPTTESLGFLSSAIDLGVVETVSDASGRIDSSNPEDLYRFHLNTPTDIAFVLYGLHADVDLELVRDTNNNGEIEASEILGGSYHSGDEPEVMGGFLEAGTYYARVLQFGGETTYSLKFDTDVMSSPNNRIANSLTTAIDLKSIAGWRTERDRLNWSETSDFYRFQLDTPSQFDLVVYGNYSDVNLTISRDDNNNGSIDFDEILATSTAWSVDISEMLDAGTYYVEVSNFSGSANYNLGFQVNAIADMAGNTLDTAMNLGVLENTQILHDVVADFDPYDYYRFDVATPTPLSLALSGLNADADVELIQDANNNGVVDFALGEVIEGSYRWGNALEEMQFESLNPGTYYVRVEQYSGNTDYTLSLMPELYSLESGYGEVNALAAVSLATGIPNEDIADELFEWDVPFDVNAIDAPDVWAHGFRGQGVTVAVVDTGVDLDHVDLAGNIWQNLDEIPDNGIDDDANGYIDDFRGWDFVNFDNDPNDVHGHGTHVAGIIAALDNDLGVTGVAPEATIMPVQVLDDSGTTDRIDRIADGIRYAADNGADAINLSLGGAGYVPEIEEALAYATARGALVVMAAGNEGAEEPSYPAHSAEQWGIAVGALSAFGGLAYWSNRAAFTGNYVVAPGEWIDSTLPDNSYGFKDGTSMAAPHVSGITALIRSANPGLTPEQVRSAIVDSATPLLV
ncbi:MAG: S8 family serine peptidase [Cyanobacteria bacterium SID2]|nr:S8 family serine peptidase [Cyanobacteria bacterium SID2]